ncbi:MAG TPA: class IV adenylate cyclase [Thermoanaerobaculia bacterium]|nr:class IV adenylate cyclase [Thermoanaerobaculia bacterium]
MTDAGPRPPRPREEVEVKIPCEDHELARAALRAAGASLVSPLHFESNDLYDDAGKKLSSQGRTVRLRRAAGRAILTYKGPARFHGGIKVREERETAVENPEEAEGILAGLGLERRFRYEKRREEWRHDGCVIALDETPIGRFIEIEGEPPAIRRVVNLLSLDFTAALPYSYARLYAEKRRDNPSLPPDMVFSDISRPHGD